VPGDGRYEWAGFRSSDELPVEHNPKRGWIATANQMNLPVDYPHAIGFEWVLPYRYERIREVLQGDHRFALEDMAKLQVDRFGFGPAGEVRYRTGLERRQR